MKLSRTFLIILSTIFSAWAFDGSAQSKEKCFGISPAGNSDGVEGLGAPRSATNTSVVDYQGNAWRLVDAGTCVETDLPPMSDGTPRRGSLVPIARDLPNQ